MATEYNITRTAGRCAACGREMEPAEEFVATIRQADEDADEEFLREDFCMGCWAGAEPDRAAAPDVFGIWRSRVPAPKEKKKLFVDDELLVSFFERLADSEEPARVQFRFVLALILMRKKLLVYDRSDRGDDGRDVWTLHFRGEKDAHKVIDPNLDEEKIADVSQQLGQILEGEL